jgi:hypothetical protein
MIKYKKIYLDAFGLDQTDFIACEVSGKCAIDFHHIIGRGKKGEDRVENLMALTRENHIEYGDKKKYMVLLLKTHRTYLGHNGVRFNNNWFEDKINYYED